MNRLLLVLASAFVATALPISASAEKLLALMRGKIYFTDGKVKEVVDSGRISVPQKNKPLLVVDHAYTSRQKVAQRIAPESVDSVVLWNATSPHHPHTIVYIADYGWCWQVEKTPAIALYAFCTKGYYIGGNGGMWTRGKFIMITDKGGILHKFTKPTKSANDSFRRQVAALVADDPALAQQIMASRYRRDKTLRMLRHYSPALAL